MPQTPQHDRKAWGYAVLAWFIAEVADMLRVIADAFDEIDQVTEAGDQP